MTDTATKAKIFSDLHVKGIPLIIYNAWDGGSAKTIASCGAKAIATGDHPVGFAHGYGNDDFSDFSFDIYLVTIQEIAKRIDDLPFSVDINNADDLTGQQLQDRIKTIIKAGAVGINYEDGGDAGMLSSEEQSERIALVRATADQLGLKLFINARTNIFLGAPAEQHAALVTEAVTRAAAYQAAGANGFFVPGLLDLELITQVTSRVDLPVNIIRLPGAPSTAELSAAKVARISYGPVPQMAMTAWLKEHATLAINGQV